MKKTKPTNLIRLFHIEGIRHRIAHEYYDLDMTTLWRVASIFAPQLIQDIEPIIADLEQSDDLTDNSNE